MPAWPGEVSGMFTTCVSICYTIAVRLKIVPYLRLCRLEHWVKNFLVFLPPFFLGVMFHSEHLRSAAPAFLSFSLVASAVYVLNDVNDRESDRLHPLKRLRPVASGEVGVAPAVALAAVLCVAGASMLLLAHSPIWAAVVLAMYFLCNVAYSVRFKNTPLVDIFLLASGFVFRIFYGGFFFGIEISSWLFLCLFSGALYFACGKRKNEMARVGAASGSRTVLKFYTQKFLDAHYYMFCGLAILFYCLWTITRTDQHAVGKLALTIPVMVFILARYNYIVESDDCDGDPVPVLFHDKWLILATLFFVALNFVILYFGAYLPRVRY